MSALNSRELELFNLIDSTLFRWYIHGEWLIMIFSVYLVLDVSCGIYRILIGHCNHLLTTKYTWKFQSWAKLNFWTRHYTTDDVVVNPSSYSKARLPLYLLLIVVFHESTIQR